MTGKEYATPFPMLKAASLLSHRVRIKKFQQAIAKIVKPDHHVIELGTGSGILAILAAKQGAKVTAIDANIESLRYAKESAEMNNVADKIDFQHTFFQEFKPEEKADVVICEMLSAVMLVEQQIPAIRYALEYLLKPSGHIIPEQVNLFIVPVQNDILWNRFEIGNLTFPRIPQTAEKGQSIDLANLKELIHFDLTTLPETEDKIDKEFEFEICQNGTVHGFIGMFESKLCDGIILNMEDGWRELFMPLPEPVEVSAGDSLKIRISFNPGEYDSLRINC
ncbi:MAG: 50S ribosomal protein L11 methyltransferase [Candidatus Thorarchaeota archaeon]